MPELDKEDEQIKKADLWDTEPAQHIAPVCIAIISWSAKGDYKEQDEQIYSPCYRLQFSVCHRIPKGKILNKSIRTFFMASSRL